MARRKTTKTRYPGVWKVDGKPNTYRVWGEVTNPKTGKRVELDRIVTAKNDRAAVTKRTELLAELEAEQPEQSERLRLKAYAASWMRSKLPELKASSRALYASVLDNYILPKLGDYYLDAITSDDIAQFRDDIAVMPVRGGGPPSPDYVNGRLAILKRIMRDAVDDENLPKDPTRRVADLRTATVTEDEDLDDDMAKSITALQLAVLLETIRETSPEWYPFFFVLAFTGLRFGEASALKWPDIDETNGKLWIRRAQWKGIVDTTKSASAKKRGRRGVRTVPLFAELLEILKAHRVAQREAVIRRLKRQRTPRLEEAIAAELGDWIFPARRRKGVKLMHNTAPAKPLRAAILAAAPKLTARGLPVIDGKLFTAHGFRHTFNNLVRQAAKGEGAGEVVRAMTGHSSEEMTEHYSHVSVQEKAAVVGRVLHLVRGSS